MTNQSLIAPDDTKQECADDTKEMHASEPMIAVAGESGWIPAEELKERALHALNNSGHVVLDFSQIDYLEASGLQIVLATSAECAKAGKSLDVVNVSPDLRVWFEQCGAADHLFSNGEAK